MWEQSTLIFHGSFLLKSHQIKLQSKINNLHLICQIIIYFYSTTVYCNHGNVSTDITKDTLCMLEVVKVNVFVKIKNCAHSHINWNPKK